LLQYIQYKVLEKYWLVGVRRSKAATVSNAKRHTVVMTASKTSQKKKGKWVGRKYYYDVYIGVCPNAYIPGI
jgi:hypothetical protein